jgi:hypothetical protein
MNAAGEARDALVRLQNTVHKHWTSGDAHAVLCSWGKKIRDKFATDNTPVFLGGAPELRPVVELLQSMKEAINNNHNQLTTHVRVLDGKVGRLEAEVKGLQVRHPCFWFLSQSKNFDTSLWLMIFLFGLTTCRMLLRDLLLRRLRRPLLLHFTKEPATLLHIPRREGRKKRLMTTTCMRRRAQKRP